jgi:FkbM family methyltransferase
LKKRTYRTSGPSSWKVQSEHGRHNRQINFPRERSGASHHLAKSLLRSVRAFQGDSSVIRKKQHDELPRTSMAGALYQLSTLGFEPQTVIDVGVACHTSELYEQFKKAGILLIEPLVEFEPFLRGICSSYNAQYVLAAAGEYPGTSVLNVHSDKVGSSFLKEIEGPDVDGSPRTVPVVTIDQLVAEKNLSGPFLIKVDVQGAELQVLCGAARTLRETEIVILEVTLFGTMLGGPQFFDIVHWMKQSRFVAYDIFGFHYRPLDNALCQVDMAFVREDGPFRKSHVYATPEQREAHSESLRSQLIALEKR